MLYLPQTTCEQSLVFYSDYRLWLLTCQMICLLCLQSYSQNPVLNEFHFKYSENRKDVRLNEEVSVGSFENKTYTQLLFSLFSLLSSTSVA